MSPAQFIQIGKKMGIRVEIVQAMALRAYAAYLRDLKIGMLRAWERGYRRGVYTRDQVVKGLAELGMPPENIRYWLRLQDIWLGVA